MSPQGTLLSAAKNGVQRAHIALIPSAGMGHITPFSRLAVSLSTLCDVTMVSTLPTVSQTESLHFSNFFSSYPNIHPLHFQLPSLDPSAYANADPFLLHWESICQSSHELLDHLITNSSTPISALVVDTAVSSSFAPLARSLNIPCYILMTTCAEFLAFLTYLPIYCESKPKSVSMGDVKVPGLRTVPVENIPQLLHDPNQFFTKLCIQTGHELLKVDGILVNTFESLEKETLTALRGGQVVPYFPPLISVGPLIPIKTRLSTDSTIFSWLDEQPENSVLYVSFGNRTAMPNEQIKELGLGLEASGCRFIWVIKTTIVDKEEEIELEELLGEEYLEKVKYRGLVIKSWVDQEVVLGHKAIGGFLSHCGWNSLTEAAIHGVRILAWPRIGDQRLDADLAVRSGLGMWVKDWSWEGEEGIVDASEIAEKVKEMMANESLTKTACKVREEARNAMAVGGSSFKGLVEFVKNLKC